MDNSLNRTMNNAEPFLNFKLWVQCSLVKLLNLFIVIMLM